MNPHHPALRELIQLGKNGRDAIPPSLPDEAAWRAFDGSSSPGTVSWIDVGQLLNVDDLEKSHSRAGAVQPRAATASQRPSRNDTRRLVVQDAVAAVSGSRSRAWRVGGEKPHRSLGTVRLCRRWPCIHRNGCARTAAAARSRGARLGMSIHSRDFIARRR